MDNIISLFNVTGFSLWEDDKFSYAIHPWLRWYGLLFALGLFIGIAIACLRIQTYYKVKYELFFYFAIIVVPVSLLGARFWSACIGDLDWKNFFNFTQSGGLAIQGGVVASVIAGLIYFPLMLKNPKYHVRCEEGKNVYILKPSLWIVIDAILPCILIGQAIGRWGNFFNGEIYGNQVSAQSLSWLENIMPGVFDRMSSFTNGVSDGIYHVPLFLYEFTINLIIFVVIYFVMPTIPEIKIGVIGSMYFISYGVERMIFESMRDSAYKFNGTYILNSLILFSGVLMFILCQFICPKFRTRQIVYQVYCKYIRKYAIILLKKSNIDWVRKALIDDPKLERYGFKKQKTFTRSNKDMLYYANK